MSLTSDMIKRYVPEEVNRIVDSEINHSTKNVWGKDVIKVHQNNYGEYETEKKELETWIVNIDIYDYVDSDIPAINEIIILAAKRCSEFEKNKLKESNYNKPVIEQLDNWRIVVDEFSEECIIEDYFTQSKWIKFIKYAVVTEGLYDSK